MGQAIGDVLPPGSEMAAKNAAIMIILLLVLGAKLVRDGIGDLSS
jgi:hypothetical protein